LNASSKTSIQARIRCYPTVAANSAHPMLVEHEYDRGGSLAYIVAWDVHRARLFGCLEPTTGIEPFGRLVSRVMTEEPYRSARRVFWVLDNGSSHRGSASVRRLLTEWEAATMAQSTSVSSTLHLVIDAGQQQRLLIGLS
jgi:hypothetical protein